MSWCWFCSVYLFLELKLAPCNSRYRFALWPAALWDWAEEGKKAARSDSEALPFSSLSSNSMPCFVFCLFCFVLLFLALISPSSYVTPLASSPSPSCVVFFFFSFFSFFLFFFLLVFFFLLLLLLFRLLFLLLPLACLSFLFLFVFFVLFFLIYLISELFVVPLFSLAYLFPNL